MPNIEQEIFNRLKTDEWNDLIARKVLSARSKRKSEKRNLIVSLIAFFLISTSYIFSNKIHKRSNEDLFHQFLQNNQKVLFSSESIRILSNQWLNLILDIVLTIKIFIQKSKIINFAGKSIFICLIFLRGKNARI